MIKCHLLNNILVMIIYIVLNVGKGYLNKNYINVKMFYMSYLIMVNMRKLNNLCMLENLKNTVVNLVMHHSKNLKYDKFEIS